MERVAMNGSFQFDAMATSPAPVLENISPERNPYSIPNLFGARSDSGVEVSHYRSLGHPPILQGVKILAGAFAQMDVQLMRRKVTPGGRESFEPVRKHPGGLVAKNRSQTRTMATGATMNVCTYRSCTMNHAIMSGDGFGAIQRDNAGRPLQKTLLPPYPDTRVVFNDEGKLKIETRIQIGASGHSEEFTLDPIDVFQIKNLSHDGLSGYPLTELAANAIGFGIGAYKYGGKTLANDATPRGVLQDPGRPSDDQVRDNLARWYIAHRGLDNASKIAYLTGGTSFLPTAMSNVDAQLVETLEHDARMQSRLLNIPPFLLGITDSSGMKMEELLRFFVQFTLGDWIVNWAEEMRCKLLTEEEWRRGDLFFKFDASRWLRANFKDLLDSLEKATGGPVLLREESRAILELNPVSDDSKFLSRSTGEPLGSDNAGNTASKQMAEVENRLQRLLINAAKSCTKTESSKLAAAVDRGEFGEWLDNYYSRELPVRLADVVSEPVANKYCSDRLAELQSAFENQGRGAIKSDASNHRARGLKLVEMELQNDGLKINQAKGERDTAAVS